MRRRDVIAILVAIAAWPHMALAQPALARMTFTLGGTSFAALLPEGARLNPSVGADEVTFDLTKGQRLERVLVLATMPRRTGASLDRQRTLPGGSRVEYAVEDNIGGGSGGPVARLTGRMEIGAHVLWVTCTDQDEWSREPGWCLPYLARLEIVAPP